MRVIFAVWAVSISAFVANAQADTTQDVQAALEAVGCMEASDGKAGRLAIRTAVRCFQKGIGTTPDGTLSEEEEGHLIEMAASGRTIAVQERYEAQQTRREELYGPEEKKPTSAERLAAMMAPQYMNRKSAPGSFASLEDLADRAEAGDPTLKRTRAVGVSMALVTSRATPVLAYRKELDWRYGFYLAETIDCVEPGVLRLVFSMELRRESRIPEGFDPNAEMDIRIWANDLGLDTILPGGGQGLGMVERIDGKGEPSTVFRVSTKTSAIGRLAKRLGATGYLRVQILSEGEPLPLRGGANLSGFETDVRPLVEYCATAHPDYEPPPPTVAEIAASQRLSLYPTEEQLQVALTRFYSPLLGMYGLIFKEADVKLSYEDFVLLRCVGVEEDEMGDTFCQFSGRLVSGAEKIGPMITGIGALATVLGPRWASLEIKQSRWVVRNVYETCHLKRDCAEFCA